MVRFSKSREIRVSRHLFHGFLGLIFLLPIPLGSNRTVFWSLAVLYAAALMLSWTLLWARGVVRIPNAAVKARWALLMLFALNIVIAIQLLPITPVTAFLQADILSRTYSENASSSGFLTADWHLTADSLLRSLGLFLLAVLTVLLVTSRRRVLLVLSTVVIAGLIQALYGSLMVLSGIEFGFLDYKEFGRGVATGSFINRNHYANFLVMSLAAGIGLLVCRMELKGYANWRDRIRHWIRALFGKKARLRIYLIIMVIALVLTRSRMGNASFFAALLITSGFTLLYMRQMSRPLLVFIASLLIIDLFLVGTWFGMEQVVERFQRGVEIEIRTGQIREQERLEANKESINMLKQAPMLGMGSGSYQTLFPYWRSPDQKFFDHAHNDYLEFGVEMGLVGLLLIGSYTVLAIFHILKALRRPEDQTAFGVGFALMMVICAMCIHAAVDFNLQIFANAAYFTILTMLAFCLGSNYRKSQNVGGDTARKL